MTVQTGQIPDSKLVFRKAAEIIKTRILAANEGEHQAKIAFEDFKATIDTEQHKVTLALKEGVNQDKYLTPEATVEFSYTASTLADILASRGYTSTYFISDKENVIAKLPEGVSHQYTEGTKQLVITVDATTNEIDFSQDNSTLVTALLGSSESFTITFVEDPINFDEIFHTRTVAFTDVAADFLEPAAPVEEEDEEEGEE